MRGVFAALGVGVVDVVVEGELVLRLGHLQQVALGEQPAHHAGLAGRGGAKVVGQLQAAARVAPGAHEVLHDLEQHPGRVFFQARFGRGQHLVAQGAQGGKPALHLARVQGAEQARGGVGDAQFARRGHLLDAVRVQVGGEQAAHARGGMAQHVVHECEQRPVAPVEVQTGGQAVRGGPGSGRLGSLRGRGGRFRLFFWGGHNSFVCYEKKDSLGRGALLRAVSFRAGLGLGARFW